MAYTTYTNIQGYYIGLDFSSSDYITPAKVKQWINEFGIQIDSNLRRKYNIPISNSNDLVLLKLLVEKMVVGKIDEILRQSSNEDEKKYTRDRNYSKQAMKELQQIIDGTIQLETGPKLLSPIAYQKGSSS